MIDSYAKTPGKGLPMENQTSQWFALYYLDGLDRLVKERYRRKYYTRYMDDCIIICEEKKFRHQYREGEVEFDEITRSIASYKGHLRHGHTYRLQQKVFHDFVLTKEKRVRIQQDEKGEQYETEDHKGNTEMPVPAAHRSNPSDNSHSVTG